MNFDQINSHPQRIICLTEESVETLYLLGKQDLICGVSAFVKRPDQAQKLPKVSLFTTSNYNKISEQNPDLIIGHSDIQKDIAKDLIERGHNVFIANHRSLTEILSYIRMLSNLVDAHKKGEELVETLLSKIRTVEELTKNLQRKPRIYFEEWDEPRISAIRWVSDLIELCGGIEINRNLSKGLLAKDRFVSDEDIIQKNPEIIFGCWCGKKVKIDSIKSRNGYDKIDAVNNNYVFELPPEIFLQPGPAPVLDGIDIIYDYIKKFNDGDLS